MRPYIYIRKKYAFLLQGILKRLMPCDPISSSIVTVWLHYVKYCCASDNEWIKLGRKRKTENASLIVNCGFLELVTLCTVICRKIPHSCNDTKMATTLYFCSGMSQLELEPILRHVIRHVASMWAGHVCSPLRWSLHSVAVGFAILCSQRWILVNLNASTIAFIEVWGNCPCLIYFIC